IDLITERHLIAAHRESGGPAANARDALAVLLPRNPRQTVAYIAIEISGHTVQAADRHQLRLDTTAAARRLAGTVTGSAEYPGKHIRFPVDHVRIFIPALRNQANVFRNRCMCWAGVLTIYNFVKILGICTICWFQDYIPTCVIVALCTADAPGLCQRSERPIKRRN